MHPSVFLFPRPGLCLGRGQAGCSLNLVAWLSSPALSAPQARILQEGSMQRAADKMMVPQPQVPPKQRPQLISDPEPDWCGPLFSPRPMA